MKKIISILIMGFLLLSLPVTVNANSALKFWEGTSATGTFSSDEDCPLIVEHEDLYFEIPDLPPAWFTTAEALKDYHSHVRAEYTFTNPTEMTITSRLVFPFGQFPSYGGIRGITDTDTDAYAVEINGQPADVRLRYTYMEHDFSVEKDLPLLLDTYSEDAFYTPDLKVTRYTLKAQELPQAEHTVLAIHVPGRPEQYRLYLDPANMYLEKQGELWTGVFINNNETVDLWVFGDDFELPDWQGYENMGLEKKISGSMVLTETEEMTLEEYAMLKYPGALITQSDWYNAIVTMLKNHTSDLGLINEIPQEPEYYLMRWYEYEFTLGPGESLKNAVTAPLYPSRDEYYKDPVYGYTYLLSPAKTWSSFGDLDVYVNTGLYMTSWDKEIFAFEKTDTGYQAHLDVLPGSELKFNLCTVKSPSRDDNGTLVVLAIVGLALVVGIILLILIIKLLIRLIRLIF
ncbi:MAG: hypothetical protein IJJ44_10200 [Solobacterium sp.]|nr:hypothetical protein [Solobacterium sp.]